MSGFERDLMNSVNSFFKERASYSLFELKKTREKMNINKAQSAIEYLMTYGWMLLVVAIAGGAIFSMVGEQNIESVQGFDSSHVNIQDFGVSNEDGLIFAMSDPIGQTTVNEVKVSDTEGSNISYIFNQDISEQNTINLPGISPSDNSDDLEVEINYDSSNLKNLTTSGMITGTLDMDRSFNNHTLLMEGLVGYWPLDERYSGEDTVYDLTSNNNHGNIINSPEVVEGLVNEDKGGLDFSSTTSRDGSYLRIDEDDSIAFEPADSFTLSTWVRVNGGDPYWRGDSWSSTGVNVFSKGSTSGSFGLRVATDFWIEDDTEDADYELEEYNFGMQIRGDNRLRASTSSFDGDDNSVHHIAGVYYYDSDTGEDVVEIYHDGSFVTENRMDREDVGDYTEYDWYRTNRHVTSGSWTDMDIDTSDHRIYDRALSEDEIEQIYSMKNQE